MHQRLAGSLSYPESQITLAETHVVAIYTQSDIPYSAHRVLALNA
jgi:hypothetical protein